jgi:hypothetical protein
MRRAALNTILVLAIVLVPLLLGALIVGPSQPVGRNTRSATRVGHKALYLLLEQLRFDVRRFERGVETLPAGRSVLIALEPGPSLFREEGAYAKNLLSWVERGNTALVTLGPDSDRPAELDDDVGELGVRAKRAIELAESIRDRAQERAQEKVEPEIERNAAQAAFEGAELDANESWDSAELTAFLRLPLLEDRLQLSRSSTMSLSGPMLDRVADASLEITRPRVWHETEARDYQVLLAVDRHPLLIELSRGQGKLLVLTEPRLFQNAVISRAAHARLAVRTVEYLAQHAETKVVLFEEFSHGGREAGSMIEVAVATRARWPLMQILLLVLLAIAAVAWRNRSVVPFEAVPRRSRDEVIDAMASLFLRASDTRGAAARLVELTRRRLLTTVPRGAEKELVPLIASRLGRDTAEVEASLDPAAVASTKDLVARARALRALRVAADAQK